MRFRFALCVILSAWVLSVGSPAWSQDMTTKKPFELPGQYTTPWFEVGAPKEACRPECEGARKAWAAAEEVYQRTLRDVEDARKEADRRKQEFAIAEQVLKTATGAESQAALALARDGARVAMDEANREHADAAKKSANAFDASEEARRAYWDCCTEEKDQPGLPKWAYIAAGAGGAAVAILAGTGSESPATTGGPAVTPPTATPPPSTPPPAQPSPQPAPSPAPAPPAVPTPADGRVGVEGHNYQIRFSSSNVDQVTSATFALGNSNCRDDFFFNQFTSPINITGTGPFIPQPFTITGSGSTTFMIGSEPIRAELSISITGTAMRATVRYDRPTCFGIYMADVIIFGF